MYDFTINQAGFKAPLLANT